MKHACYSHLFTYIWLGHSQHKMLVNIQWSNWSNHPSKLQRLVLGVFISGAPDVDRGRDFFGTPREPDHWELLSLHFPSGVFMRDSPKFHPFLSIQACNRKSQKVNPFDICERENPQSKIVKAHFSEPWLREGTESRDHSTSDANDPCGTGVWRGQAFLDCRSWLHSFTPANDNKHCDFSSRKTLESTHSGVFLMPKSWG